MKSRVLICSSMKQFWNSYIADINKPVSLFVKWRDIKRLLGDFTIRPFTQFNSNSLMISSPQNTADLLATYLAAISLDDNYNNCLVWNKFCSGRNFLWKKTWDATPLKRTPRLFLHFHSLATFCHSLSLFLSAPVSSFNIFQVRVEPNTNLRSTVIHWAHLESKILYKGGCGFTFPLQIYR